MARNDLRVFPPGIFRSIPLLGDKTNAELVAEAVGRVKGKRSYADLLVQLRT